MIAVYQKELKSYFNNLFGYLYIAIILLVVGIFASLFHFSYLSGDIAYTLSNVTMVVFLVTPLLTMRIIAEERQKKTDQLLYSLPISVTSIVVAKYLAMLTVYMIPMLVICVYPFVMAIFGAVNFARSFGSILAFILMGACLLAVGMFISSLTENQVVSAILSFVTMLLMYLASSVAGMVPATAMASFVALVVLAIILGVIVFIMVKNYLVALGVTTFSVVGLTVLYMLKKEFFEGLFGDIIGWLAINDRCVSFYNGIFDLTSIIYFLSVIFLFVFLTVQAVEKRRWS